MKSLILLFPLFLLSLFSYGQTLCPGGGTSFANSVTFDQAWINGCSTGTSCNGGYNFDSRTGCLPGADWDACAPTPTCTVQTNSSNLWFKFYAMGPTAEVHVYQNTSLVVAVQAFSGGPGCGSLTQIGCNVAGGPSQGVILSLSGLTIYEPYYLRVFGSANNASQRSGLFCFCGSVGVGSVMLPIVLSSFNAMAQRNKVLLSWQTSTESGNKNFEVQHSIDANNYTTIATIAGIGTSALRNDYTFTDATPWAGTNYYRLKQIDQNDHFTYSRVITAKTDMGNTLAIVPNMVTSNLVIQASAKTQAVIMNGQGMVLQQLNLFPGRNQFSVAGMESGMYLLRSANGEIQKFMVGR